MFQLKWITGVVFAVASITLIAPVAQAKSRVASFVNDDDIFMALRDAARKDDAAKAAELADRLPDYAIPSYVDYYRLKPRLQQASSSEIREYLRRYNGSAIADRLRNDWLLILGQRRDFVTFDEQYPLFALDDDLQLKCYSLLSRATRGEQVAVAARALLVSPKDYGEACSTLITTLAGAGQFTPDDLWWQLRAAGETSQVSAARRLAPLLSASDAQIVQSIEKAPLVLARGVGNSALTHQLFIVALGRVSRTSPEQAASALSNVESQLSPGERALGWSQIALQASLKLMPEATTLYWSRTDGAPLTSDGYQWRARMALRNGDWTLIRRAIEAMPPDLRDDGTWIYWRARALGASGDVTEAQKLFKSIADQTNFYGQLALEDLGQKISIPIPGAPLTAQEIAPLAANPGLRRALKFFDMNLRFEAVREWNWELRSLSEREHLAAAEFARQNNVLDRMVNTSDRTRSERDFNQRFPSPFRDFMVTSTNALGLDMAWVYGLIRQESRFIMNARSHVGASGLMQLMPATARYVAKKIGMTSFDPDQVNEVSTNIALGTNYLNMVLGDLDGSQAMATAAYNAGPGRPRSWRSSLTRQVEGAVFAESIPFAETRGYVKNVLSNATYYAALFDGKPQSLKARLGMIAPKGFVASELP
ncbi:transglycosylase SLT domain-containing protein [Actimicrobium sp. CCC2.4]|uniref:lytic transglycosylase domain-containing protein n=1 Tax=Actimicrobium sp. CCC2.4 TaxID=3048606 RepID=UPI002AC917E2|nr:transglycosylase SLT domain-containing protein [Actimicrobium sp. CCC2.4]MEB0134224.1 transglycosylase SLT domain-containing protein [Actimicrobium sp. CCC2.4]WPX32874.1 transglycosylase SLT domain-containing protein [Actimicrobium sp. CCC2.4]